MSFIDGLSAESRIADIGCGSGTQTLYLAKNTEDHITASDMTFVIHRQTYGKCVECISSGSDNRIVADMEYLTLSGK